ncbi:gluconokinase [Luteimonas notoginsengisoli]
MPAQPQAIVVIGVAGSGKSTVARALAGHYGFVLLDADDFHTADAKARMAAGIPLTDAHRDPWVDALACELQRAAQQGRSSVLAFSGLRAAHRQRLRDSGVPARFVSLHASPEVIAARLAARRDHFMSPQLLASQFDDLQLPIGEPDVVIVGVDRPLEQVLDEAVAALAGT